MYPPRPKPRRTWHGLSRNQSAASEHDEQYQMPTGTWMNFGLKHVATLALGSRPSHCARKCEGMNPPHSQVSSHFGSWNPNGLLNLQKVITWDKTHWIEKFLISLENYWNLNVKNGFTWSIWLIKTQVMAKRKAMSQIVNLTPDH